MSLFFMFRQYTESFRPLLSFKACINHSYKVIVLGVFFPSSRKVIFLGTSFSLHILGSYLREGSVSFMTIPFTYVQGWQFSVYPLETLSTECFRNRSANRNASARFTPSHPQGCSSPSFPSCSSDTFLQIQPPHAPWGLSSALAALPIKPTCCMISEKTQKCVGIV